MFPPSSDRCQNTRDAIAKLTMLKTLSLALAATLFTPIPVLAENWVLVTQGESGTQYYIDTESIERDRGTTRFWRMTVATEPDERGILAEKTYIAMICPLRAWRREAVARFNPQGQLINREEFSEDAPLQFFTSGSVGEGIWKFVCE